MAARAAHDNRPPQTDRLRIDLTAGSIQERRRSQPSAGDIQPGGNLSRGGAPVVLIGPHVSERHPLPALTLESSGCKCAS